MLELLKGERPIVERGRHAKAVVDEREADHHRQPERVAVEERRRPAARMRLDAPRAMLDQLGVAGGLTVDLSDEKNGVRIGAMA